MVHTLHHDVNSAPKVQGKVNKDLINDGLVDITELYAKSINTVHAEYFRHHYKRNCWVGGTNVLMSTQPIRYLSYQTDECDEKETVSNVLYGQSQMTMPLTRN